MVEFSELCKKYDQKNFVCVKKEKKGRQKKETGRRRMPNGRESKRVLVEKKEQSKNVWEKERWTDGKWYKWSQSSWALQREWMIYACGCQCLFVAHIMYVLNNTTQHFGYFIFTCRTLCASRPVDLIPFSEIIQRTRVCVRSCFCAHDKRICCLAVSVLFYSIFIWIDVIVVAVVIFFILMHLTSGRIKALKSRCYGDGLRNIHTYQPNEALKIGIWINKFDSCQFFRTV